MGVFDSIRVEDNVEINGVVLEKGNYQSKDLHFPVLGSDLHEWLETNQYRITKSGLLELVNCRVERLSKKNADRLHLKPNGIINIYRFDDFLDYRLDYRLVLENGVIKEIYRANTLEEIENYPETIQMNYDADWLEHTKKTGA